MSRRSDRRSTGRRAARTAAHAAGRTAVQTGRVAGRTARTTGRAAADHPRAAASGVGIGTLVAAAVAGVVLVKIARSRRVQHAAASSARRGAFGPGVATAARVADQVRAEHS